MQAVIFPGQSSQYQGMGRSLYDNFPCSRDIFSAIDEILGWSISEVCFYGDEEKLKDTYYQQLAILAVSLAAYEAFKEKNIKFEYLSGLSIGECIALYPAGVLSLPEVVYLIEARARFMQEASNNTNSTMLAVIGLSRQDISVIEGDFYISNINSVQQIVIALEKDKVETISSLLERKGAKVIPLNVSGGFHSPFMQEAKDKLSESINKLSFKKAKIPMVSNVDARAEREPEKIKENILKQLISPVLWLDCVMYMQNNGVDTFYEIGPSRILKGLIRKINRQLKVINIEKKEDLDNLKEGFKDSRIQGVQ